MEPPGRAWNSSSLRAQQPGRVRPPLATASRDRALRLGLRPRRRIVTPPRVRPFVAQPRTSRAGPPRAPTPRRRQPPRVVGRAGRPGSASATRTRWHRHRRGGPQRLASASITSTTSQIWWATASTRGAGHVGAGGRARHPGQPARTSRSQCGAPSPAEGRDQDHAALSGTSAARATSSATSARPSSSAVQASAAPDDKMLPSRAKVGSVGQPGQGGRHRRVAGPRTWRSASSPTYRCRTWPWPAPSVVPP